MPFQKVSASWKNKIRPTNLSTTTEIFKITFMNSIDLKISNQNHKNKNKLKKKQKNERKYFGKNNKKVERKSLLCFH